MHRLKRYRSLYNCKVLSEKMLQLQTRIYTKVVSAHAAANYLYLSVVICLGIA